MSIGVPASVMNWNWAGVADLPDRSRRSEVTNTVTHDSPGNCTDGVKATTVTSRPSTRSLDSDGTPSSDTPSPSRLHAPSASRLRKVTRIGDAADSDEFSGVVSISSEKRSTIVGLRGAPVVTVGDSSDTVGGRPSSSSTPREATTVQLNSWLSRSPVRLRTPCEAVPPPARVRM